MKVNENIKKAIRNCAKYNAKAAQEEKIIYKWLEQHRLTEETAIDVLRNMDDSFIDCCQTEYNPESFIRTLEELEE